MIKNNELYEYLKQCLEEAFANLTLNDGSNKEQWAKVNSIYAESLKAFAEEETEPLAYQHYEDSIAAFEQNLEVFRITKNFAAWFDNAVALSRVIRLYGYRERGHRGFYRLKEAEKLFCNIEAKVEQHNFSYDKAMLLREKGHLFEALALINIDGQKEAYLKKSARFLSKSANLFQRQERFGQWAVCIYNLAGVFIEYSALLDDKKAIKYLLKANKYFYALEIYYETLGKYEELYQICFESADIYFLLARFYVSKKRNKVLCKAEEYFQKCSKLLHKIDVNDNALAINLKAKRADTLSLLAQFSTDHRHLLLQAIKFNKEVAKFYLAQEEMPNYYAAMSSLGKNYVLYSNLNLHNEQKFSKYLIFATRALKKADNFDFQKIAPAAWLSNVIELGAAYHFLGNMHNKKEKVYYYQMARRQYNKALLALDNSNSSIVARLHEWLSSILMSLGLFYERHQVRFWQKSFMHIETSLQKTPIKDNYLKHIDMQLHQCYVSMALANRLLNSDDKRAYDILESCYNKTKNLLSIIDKKHLAEQYIKLEIYLGNMLILLAQKDGEDCLLQAEAAFYRALDLQRMFNNNFLLLNINMTLANLYISWSKMACKYKKKWYYLKKAEDVLAKIETKKITESFINNGELLLLYEKFLNRKKDLSRVKARILAFIERFPFKK